MAKRNCRRTEQERTIHERAVALRKMTDEQLVGHVDRQYTAGIDTGRIGIELTQQETGEKILAAISEVKGIGAATITKIRAVIQEITGGDKA